MLKSTNLVVLLFLLIFTIGCKDEPIDEGVDVTIENEFKILLWESLEENSRVFSYKVETIKAESCENTLIDVTPSINLNNISITIHDIPAPDCPLPNFMAEAKVDVGSLTPLSYRMVISLKNVIENEGTLTVDDDYYELTMDELNGIIIPENRLYRVPQNTIWGYIASSNSNADSVVDEFIDELEDVTDSQDYIDGYYGYYSVLNDKLTILDQDVLQSSIHTTFGFSYQGDNSDLMNILATYRSQNVGVDFKLFTSKGEEL